MNNLFRAGNNIISSHKYPTNVKKFGQAHRQISRMYDQILGKACRVQFFAPHFK